MADLSNAAIVVGWGIQLGIFVWGAATIAQTVTTLKDTVNKLGTTLDAIVDKVSAHGEEIAVLKAITAKGN